MRIVVCLVDLTVWPSNSAFMQNALSTLSSILAMSSNHFAWVQCPLIQSQTSLPALVKHQHMLDNLLLKNGLEFSPNIQLLFRKPDSTSRDGRQLAQRVLGVTHSNFENGCIHRQSNAISAGYVGPLPLVKLTDMLGFDEVAKPGPSPRTEQQLF